LNRFEPISRAGICCALGVVSTCRVHFGHQPAHPRIADEKGRSTAAIRIFMKILLAILGIVLVAASFVADYKWRKWMADRRRDRQ
jgi:hypothetical protein